MNIQHALFSNLYFLKFSNLRKPITPFLLFKLLKRPYLTISSIWMPSGVNENGKKEKMPCFTWLGGYERSSMASCLGIATRVSVATNSAIPKENFSASFSFAASKTTTVS
jgi:hypothetical protein